MNARQAIALITFLAMTGCTREPALRLARDRAKAQRAVLTGALLVRSSPVGAPDLFTDTTYYRFRGLCSA